MIPPHSSNSLLTTALTQLALRRQRVMVSFFMVVAVVHFSGANPGGTVEFDVHDVVECPTDGDGACEQWVSLGRISLAVPGLSSTTDE